MRIGFYGTKTLSTTALNGDAPIGSRVITSLDLILQPSSPKTCVSRNWEGQAHNQDPKESSSGDDRKRLEGSNNRKARLNQR